MADRSIVTAAELAEQLAALGARWSVDGRDLKLVLAGHAGMARCGKAIAFATALADELDHHPHIVMDYPGTTLTIHTHDREALTRLDFTYAARLEHWLREHAW